MAPVLAPKSEPAAPKPKSQSPKTQQSNVAAAHARAVERLAKEPSPPARESAGERERSSSGGSRVALLVAAAAIIGGAWFFLQPKDEPSAAKPQQETKVEPARPIQDPAKLVVAHPEPAKAEPGPVPTISETPPPTPSAAASNAPTASDGLIVVTVTTIPPEARFFYKGKPVGRSPFRVELKPGQRRSFEIGSPGYHARKVVVDGTKKEFTVSMRPALPTAPAPPAPPAD